MWNVGRKWINSNWTTNLATLSIPESDLRETVNVVMNWVVRFNVGKTELAAFNRLKKSVKICETL